MQLQIEYWQEASSHLGYVANLREMLQLRNMTNRCVMARIPPADRTCRSPGSGGYSRSPNRNSAARSRRICGNPCPGRKSNGAGASRMMP